MILQLIGDIGGAYVKSMLGMQFSPQGDISWFDIARWVGGHIFGLVGLGLLIWGIVAFIRSKNIVSDEEYLSEALKEENRIFVARRDEMIYAKETVCAKDIDNPTTKPSIHQSGKVNKGRVMTIINSVIMVVPIVLYIIGYDDYYYENRDSFRYFYLTTFISIIVANMCNVLHRIKFKKSKILPIIIILLLATTSVYFLFVMEESWFDNKDVLILHPSFALVTYSWIIKLVLLVPILIEHYRRSIHYKMSCYKKIDKIFNLKQKGVISNEEYEVLKEQISKKIR